VGVCGWVGVGVSVGWVGGCEYGCECLHAHC